MARDLEGLKAWRRANTEKNRKRINESKRLWRSKNPTSPLFDAARSRARKKKIRFAITTADIIIPARCPLLDIPLKKNRGKVGPNSPTLDRIDPREGYVPGNVWVISSRANTIKSDATPDEILAVASGVRAYLKLTRNK